MYIGKADWFIMNIKHSRQIHRNINTHCKYIDFYIMQLNKVQYKFGIPKWPNYLVYNIGIMLLIIRQFDDNFDKTIYWNGNPLK